MQEYLKHKYVTHQYSEKQRLDLGVCKNVLIQEDIGFRHRHFAQMRVGYSLSFWNEKEVSGIHSFTTFSAPLATKDFFHIFVLKLILVSML